MKTSSNKHIICKQVLDLKFPRTAPSFEWQHEMSRYYHHHLLSLLEQACNELCEEGEVIQLDKVVIDLGVLRLKDIKAGVFSEQLYSLLLEQLRKNIPPAVRIAQKAAGSLRLSVARQWLYYMQRGYLPWNTIKPDATWYNYVLEAFATDFQAVTLLREQLLHSATVLQRVIRDHQPAFLIQLIEILTATSQVNILPVFHELAILHAMVKSHTAPATGKTSGTTTSIPSSYSLPAAISQQLWELAIKMAAGKNSKGISALQIAKAFIQTSLKPEELAAVTIEKEKIPICTPLLQEVILTPAAVTPAVLPSEAYTALGNNDAIPAEGIFLIHAGLVILNPFLNTFFKKLGLLKNNQFADITAHEKALYLLHYLATGETETAEHALVVPKLLCAWPLGKNLAQEIVLTPEECQEADELLEVVIEHWEKLQHTSVDALRSGFLQRNGKVFTFNDQSFIQVEQQPLDILLDYLPWSISHIRLPWMKTILRVEWR